MDLQVIQRKWCKNNSPLNLDSSKQWNYCGKRGHNEEDFKENIREDKVESSQKINFSCAIIQDHKKEKLNEDTTFQQLKETYLETYGLLIQELVVTLLVVRMDYSTSDIQRKIIL